MGNLNFTAIARLTENANHRLSVFELGMHNVRASEPARHARQTCEACEASENTRGT